MSTIGVMHRVLVIDLVELAKLWDISEDELGLKIDTKGDLVPVSLELDEPDQGTAVLASVLGAAKREYPVMESRLGLVLNFYSPDEGVPQAMVLTVDEALDLEKREAERYTFRWWTYTDTYREMLQ